MRNRSAHPCFFLAAVLAVVLVAGASRRAEAQIRIGADAGAFIPSGQFGDNVEPALALGGSLHYVLAKPHLAFGVTASHATFRDIENRPDQGNGPDLSLNSVQGSVQLSFPTGDEKMHAYVSLDGGLGQFSLGGTLPDMPGRTSVSAVVVTPSLGLRIALVEALELDVHVRYTYAVSNDFIRYGMLSSTKTVSGLVASIGAAYTFGSKKKY